MPFTPIEMEKRYMSIKEAAKYLGVTALTLRNWDKKGKLSPNRHPINNYRLYDKRELDLLYKKMEFGTGPQMIYPKKQKPQVYQIKVKHIKD